MNIEDRQRRLVELNAHLERMSERRPLLFWGLAFLLAAAIMGLAGLILH